MRSIDPAVESVPCGRWLLHDDPLWPAVLARLHHDIYHHPAYLGAEARWIGGRPEAFLHVEGDALWFAPYIARRARLPGLRAAGRIFDVVSPYGYPGRIGSPEHAAPGFRERAFAAFLAGLRERGAISMFLRNHPCLDALPPVEESQLLTERAWATVLVGLDSDLATIWQGVSRRRRQQVARAARTGMRARRIAFRDGLPWLQRIYDETMERVGVAGHDRFDAAYFQALAPLTAHLDVRLVELHGVPVVATLVSRLGGLVQTLVGGTSTAAMAYSPDRLLIRELIVWAHATGARAVYLGGGVGGLDDGVLRFKASFGAGRVRFRTVRAVHDLDRYAGLTRARATSLGGGPSGPWSKPVSFLPTASGRPTRCGPRCRMPPDDDRVRCAARSRLLPQLAPFGRCFAVEPARTRSREPAGSNRGGGIASFRPAVLTRPVTAGKNRAPPPDSSESTSRCKKIRQMTCGQQLLGLSGVKCRCPAERAPSPRWPVRFRGRPRAFERNTDAQPARGRLRRHVRHPRMLRAE